MDHRKQEAAKRLKKWLLWAVLAVATCARAGTVSFNIQTPAQNPAPGQTSYQLMMHAPKASVAGLDLSLSYRPSSAPLATVIGGPLAMGMSWAVNTNEPGTIRLALAGANPAGGEGVVLAIAFNTIEMVTVAIDEVLVNEGAIDSSINVNTAPKISGPDRLAINELAALVFTNLVADLDVPANRLSLSLEAGPAGLTMTPQGIVTWTPTEAQGPSTNDIIVRATDNGMPPLSTTKTITIVVNEVNDLPVLTSIGNKSVKEGELLTFTPTATDTDIPVQTLQFSLDAGAPEGAAINASSGEFTWTPTEAQGPSTYLVTLRVSDGVSSASETISIVVTEVNVPPLLKGLTDQTINELTTLQVTNIATDADIPANTLTFSLVSAPQGVTLDPTTGVLLWTPTEMQGPSTNVIFVKVTDNGEPPLSDTKSFKVVVSEVNTAPVLTSIEKTNINEGNLLSFTATATDSDFPAQTLTFTLDAGAPPGAAITTGGVFSWIPTEAQGPSTNLLTIRVSDGVTNVAETTTIVVHEVNSMPVLDAISDKSAYPNRALSFMAIASDIDLPSQALAFSLVTAPPGAVIDPLTGRFSWTPNSDKAGSSQTVTVQVADNGVPPLTARQTFSINVRALQDLLLEVPSDQNIDELKTLQTTNRVNDAEQWGRTMTFELIDAPAGMAIEAGSGRLTWTPTEEQGPSTNHVVLRVFDDGTPMRNATNSFVVVVNEVNTKPLLMVPNDQTIKELTTLQVTNVASDVDIPSNTLVFNLVSAPKGASLDPVTGVLIWTPTEELGPSTNIITVKVTDNGTPTLSETKSFHIVVIEVNTPPVLAVVTDQTIEELTTLVLTNTATDIDFPANKLSYALVTAPTGMTLDSITGVIHWTPTEAQGPSTNGITIKVTDNGTPPLSNLQRFQVVVKEVNRPPTLGTLVNQTVKPNQALSFFVTAADGDFPVQRLSFTLDTAPLGAGIEKTTGLFTWIPSINQTPSTNAVVVRITDDGSPSLYDTKFFSIVVRAATELRILSVERPVNGQVVLNWAAESGAIYEVVFKDQLGDPTWTSLGKVSNVGDSIRFSDSVGTKHQRFYQIKLLQ